MPTIWETVDDDVAAVMEQDGVEVHITPVGGTRRVVRGFFEAESLDGGELAGPRFWCADDDLPSGLTPGGSLLYPIDNGTTYTIAQKENDGHGMTTMLLTDESTI